MLHGAGALDSVRACSSGVFVSSKLGAPAGGTSPISGRTGRSRSEASNPVLSLSCSPGYGVAYTILRARHYPDPIPVSLTSEVFEIVNPSIPSWWVAQDFYRSGIQISLLPEAWAAHQAKAWDPNESEFLPIPLFVQEVERIYAAEGLPPPTRRGDG